MSHSSAPSSLALAAALLAFASLPASATWTYDPSAKTLAQGTVVLQNVTANGTALTINDNRSNTTATDVDLSTGVADGYSVAAIAQTAFNGNSSLTRIVFPDTLTSLGNSSFRSCANLTCEISLPASLAGELGWTFRDSPVTGDVVVPDGVTKMKETFYNTKITSLVCGAGLANVQGGDGLCQKCTSLTNVVFQSGCSLGQNEFVGCTALENVTFHPDMSGAWIQTFKGCTNLTGDIKLPRGVTGMKETFYKTRITSFETLGTALEYIGYWGNGDGDFRDCALMTNCVLNPGLKTIGLRVFQGCSSLTDIVIPDTVENFGSGFGGCTSLTNVVMPKKLVKICSRVFTGSTPINVWWRGYPQNGFTFGGTDTSDPMWDMYRANIVTNWIRIQDKASWEAAAETYPDYVSLPPEVPHGATGWWKGGYRSSAKTVLRWWYDEQTLLLLR